MKKEQIRQYFKLAPIAKSMLASDKILDIAEQLIIEGYLSLEEEYMKYLQEVNSIKKMN